MTRLKFLRLLGAALFASLVLWLGWYWAAVERWPVRCLHWPLDCDGQSSSLVGYFFVELLERSFGIYRATNALWLLTQLLPFLFGWILRARLGALLQRLWTATVDRI